MTPTELRTIQQPVAALAQDDVPPSLLERASAYNAAVDAFHAVVRAALRELRDGGAIATEHADTIRNAASGLVTAREWLVELARLPSSSRRS